MIFCIGRFSCCTSRSGPCERSFCCFCQRKSSAINHSSRDRRTRLLTRSSASSARTAKCKHDRRFHTPSFLLRQRKKWGNHLNSCWRFQFSPETYRTKWELRKRVCRSLTIAFCMDLHTSGHRIRRWVEQLSSTTRDSFWCSDSACDWFEPKRKCQVKFIDLIMHGPSINVDCTYDSLPTRDQFHLACRVVDISIGRADGSVLRRTVTVDGT
jgi:hypothetical protein